MKKDLVIGIGVGVPVIIIMIVIGGGGHTSLDFEDKTIDEPTINSFEECIAAGNPAMESHPRQCRTEDGQHFVEILEQIVCPQGFEPVDGKCPDRPVVEPKAEETEPTQLSQDCSGNARCITGIVTKIIDGDTIHVNDQSIRFALASAPELSGYGGVDSRDFIQTICPVGSSVLVDEDDNYPEGSYDRIVGVIYCNGMNLNQELLDADLGYLADRFCDSSEFAAESWAVKHGC